MIHVEVSVLEKEVIDVSELGGRVSQIAGDMKVILKTMGDFPTMYVAADHLRALSNALGDYAESLDNERPFKDLPE